MARRRCALGYVLIRVSLDISDGFMKISVLMPVFNASPYLPDAIDSILLQTFTDFELIIVDDGSTDNSLEVAENYACKDSRVRVLRNAKNYGLSYCRNRHLREAQGEYLALMDADDVSETERLRIQNDFLDDSPDVAIVGTWVKLMEERVTDGGNSKIWRTPTQDWGIKSDLLYGPPLANPSVMMRAAPLKRHGLCYDESYVSAEDYLFWVDSCPLVKMANIPVPLLHYRIHAHQNSTVHQGIRRAAHIRISQKHLLRFGIEAKADILRHLLWPRDFPCASVTEIGQVRKLLDVISSIKSFYGYGGISPQMKRNLRKRYRKVWKEYIRSWKYRFL